MIPITWAILIVKETVNKQECGQERSASLPYLEKLVNKMQILDIYDAGILCHCLVAKVS